MVLIQNILQLSGLLCLPPLDVARKCLPIYNCEPGHEIVSCSSEMTEDKCEPCKSGLVQPDYISSSNNLSDKTCFVPVSECSANDIVYRRTAGPSFCESLSGCKCDTAKCFYGDPCLCSKNNEGCPVNQTLSENGDCIMCPNGTWKNYTGCGPCLLTDIKFYHDQIEKYLTRQSENDRTVMATDRYKVNADKISSHVIQEDETTASMTTSKSKEIFTVKEGQKERNENQVCQIIIISEAVLIVGLLVAMVLLYRRRTVLSLCPKCSLSAEGQQLATEEITTDTSIPLVNTATDD